MFKKIIYFIIAFVVLILLAGCVIQTHRLECYRDQCEQYRIQLEAATNRERDIESSIQRAGAILGQSINSIGELREQIKEVRKCYEEMENWLLCAGNNNGAFNNDVTNYTNEEELK